MLTQEPTSAVVAEPSAVLGTVAGLLADGADLPTALSALVAGLGLRGAAVRSGTGELLGSAGEVLQVASAPVLEIPVPARAGATLTVTGARPSHLSALRAAANVLALALARTGGPALMDAAAEELDELADSLHDGAVQALVVAKLAADAAVRGGDAAAARDAVQEALVGMRRAMWQIRPRGGSGLGEALAQLSAQRVDAGLPALGLVLDVDLTGTTGALAYRIAQAAAATRVATRRVAEGVSVDIDGGPLPHPELWAARARVLGGDLFSSAGRIRLVLPLSTSARTAP